MIIEFFKLLIIYGILVLLVVMWKKTFFKVVVIRGIFFWYVKEIIKIYVWYNN